jgi:hypothetical protein
VAECLIGYAVSVHKKAGSRVPHDCEWESSRFWSKRKTIFSLRWGRRPPAMSSIAISRPLGSIRRRMEIPATAIVVRNDFINCGYSGRPLARTRRGSATASDLGASAVLERCLITGSLRILGRQVLDRARELSTITSYDEGHGHDSAAPTSRTPASLPFAGRSPTPPRTRSHRTRRPSPRRNGRQTITR